MDRLQKLFEYEGKQVRTVFKNDEPWFVAKDVCEVFGDSNYRRSVARLDSDEKGVSPLNTLGGKQEMAIVNEAGLYSLLFQMQPQKKASMTDEQYDKRVDSLRKFKRWITHEVIPMIRKTGGYVANDDLFIQTYLPHADSQTQLLFRATLETVRKQNEQITEMTPKVEMFDVFLSGENTQTISDVAKTLGVGPRKLGDFLREQRVLMADNTPYAPYMDRKYFEVVQVPVENGGSSFNRKQTRVTPKGLEFITRLLQNPKPVVEKRPSQVPTRVSLTLNQLTH